MTAATLELPKLNAELWPHQRDAIARAADQPGYLLAHDMGTGKSATTVGLIEHDQAARVLVLCPKNVVGVWPAQLNGPLDPPGPPNGFSPREWGVWAGAVQGRRGPKRNPSVPERAVALEAARDAADKLRRPFAAVVNYEACHLSDMGALLLAGDWDVLVLDESHRIKSPSGKASKHAAKIAARVRANGGRVLALTGTPFPHTPLDAWAQLRALDGGDRLGTTYSGFCQRYGEAETIRVAGGNERTVYKSLREDRRDEFTDAIGDVMHSVAADDVLDLPEATDHYLDVELSKPARAAYEQLERHGIADLDHGTLHAANAMTLVLRLMQASSGFGVDVDTGEHVPLDPKGDRPDKARVLDEFLTDVPAREPIVVFSHFHADLDAIRDVAERQGRRYGELSGRRRDGVTDSSKMSPAVDVLGAQLQSGGVGIDLTRARIGVYYSQDFRLADYRQSRARLVRPGQTRPVLFAHLLASNTIDRAVYGALAQRQEAIDAVVAYLTTKGAHQ